MLFVAELSVMNSGAGAISEREESKNSGILLNRGQLREVGFQVQGMFSRSDFEGANAAKRTNGKNVGSILRPRCWRSRNGCKSRLQVPPTCCGRVITAAALYRAL
jgi:hypothetical protein